MPTFIVAAGDITSPTDTEGVALPVDKARNNYIFMEGAFSGATVTFNN